MDKKGHGTRIKSGARQDKGNWVTIVNPSPFSLLNSAHGGLPKKALKGKVSHSIIRTTT